MWWVALQQCSHSSNNTTSQTNILCPRLNSFSNSFVEVNKTFWLLIFIHFCFLFGWPEERREKKPCCIDSDICDAENEEREHTVSLYSEEKIDKEARAELGPDSLTCGHRAEEEGVTRVGAVWSVTYSWVMREQSGTSMWRRNSLKPGSIKSKEVSLTAGIFAVYLTVYLRFIGA